VRRGEIWTQAGGPGYAGKPRPVLVIQSDLMIGTDSVIVALFTTHEAGALQSRVPIMRSARNGLYEDSDLMADKIMTVPRERLGKRIGIIADTDVARMDQALLLVLGFEG
jgi:mRNA interferase MazF